MPASLRVPQPALTARHYRAYVLVVLLLVNVVNQWDRYLLNYLSAVTLHACVDTCDGVAERICTPCPVGDGRCATCHDCLQENDVGHVNAQGACVARTRAVRH